MKKITKRLRSIIYDSPVFIRKINGYLVIAWILMIPISLALGWLSSVNFVSVLSLWALVAGHLAVWQSARVEEAVDEAVEEEMDFGHHCNCCRYR
jgi:hypothetical protein